MGSVSCRSREVPSVARTLPIGGRCTCVPVEAAPLGRGASAVVPLARDGRPVPDLDRGGPPAAVAREDGRDGVRTTLRPVADARRSVPGARRLDRLGHPTTRAGEASGHPEVARRAVAERGGVPDSMDELMDLPGVGRYAASATLAVAFEQRAPVVDGVSARVYRRYFGLEAVAPAASDGQLWELVSEATPPRRTREWNWAVLDLAASVCLPKVPRCEECPLRTRCAWSLGSG